MKDKKVLEKVFIKQNLQVNVLLSRDLSKQERKRTILKRSQLREFYNSLLIIKLIPMPLPQLDQNNRRKKSLYSFHKKLKNKLKSQISPVTQVLIIHKIKKDQVLKSQLLQLSKLSPIKLQFLFHTKLKENLYKHKNLMIRNKCLCRLLLHGLKKKNRHLQIKLRSMERNGTL